MGIRNINLSFSQVYLCFPDFSWFYQNTVSICEDTQPKNTEKIVEAPEFWCPGTRTLVPFQVDNRRFIVISRMGIRKINLSFSHLYLCVPDISCFYWNTASINESSPSRKPRKKMGGYQSS